METDTAVSAIEEYFADQFHLSLSNIYWAEFHTHTKYSFDALKCGALSPENAYTYAHDKAKLEIIIDGCVDQESTVNRYSLQKILILTTGRHYVYLRATMQTDGGAIVKAWTSPVYLKPPAS